MASDQADEVVYGRRNLSAVIQNAVVLSPGLKLVVGSSRKTSDKAASYCMLLQPRADASREPAVAGSPWCERKVIEWLGLQVHLPSK